MGLQGEQGEGPGQAEAGNGWTSNHVPVPDLRAAVSDQFLRRIRGVRPYFSPVLFHGPQSREVAMEQLPEIGRLIHDPFGEEGLKIADSREIIELMNNAAIGDIPGVVFMGPLDRAQQMATDVLLKSIEEFDPTVVRPVLWAFNFEDVSPTIRSRCLHQWCPGEVEFEETLLDSATYLVDAALAKRRAVVVELLKEAGEEILPATVHVLSKRKMDKRMRLFWEQLRNVLRVRQPTANEILAAFL